MKRPDADASLEALFPVLNGQLPVVINANLEREILRALDLAKKFKLKAIIAGGQEAWKVTDQVQSEAVFCRFCCRSIFRNAPPPFPPKPIPNRFRFYGPLDPQNAECGLPDSAKCPV